MGVALSIVAALLMGLSLIIPKSIYLRLEEKAKQIPEYFEDQKDTWGILGKKSLISSAIITILIVFGFIIYGLCKDIPRGELSASYIAISSILLLTGAIIGIIILSTSSRALSKLYVKWNSSRTADIAYIRFTVIWIIGLTLAVLALLLLRFAPLPLVSLLLGFAAGALFMEIVLGFAPWLKKFITYETFENKIIARFGFLLLVISIIIQIF